MQIIIPMSGFGERFRKAGYSLPKPLIEVSSKPIIEHVVNLFPGETDFIFICNQDHLDHPEYKMRETLRRIAPNGKIYGIPPHKLGPVYAVQCIREKIDLLKPTIVNYCDFTCYWNWDDVKKFFNETNSDGCIPAYKGFHPHMLGPNNYAFIKESNGWLIDIQEKNPFTKNRSEEYASSGTYYFKTGDLMLRYFDRVIEEKLSVNEEYYVSMVYRPMAKDGLKTSIYELQHFMQWGTPEDVAEYNYWCSAFDKLANSTDKTFDSLCGTLLLPMAGAGKRFADEGYETPKPLIPVSGAPMVTQAARDLPKMKDYVFILRKDLPELELIKHRITDFFPNSKHVILEKLTDGQARTCLLGLRECRDNNPVLIGACDNGLLYNFDEYKNLHSNEEIDLIVWGVVGHPPAISKPNSYGWIDADGENVKGVSVKKPLRDPKVDPVITGTFTFRSPEIYERCFKYLEDNHLTVNGEYYVDSCIEAAIKLGLNVKLFLCSHYLSWGTPNELKTFEYWQSCFSKWKYHSYSLIADSRIPRDKILELESRFSEKLSPRPQIF